MARGSALAINFIVIQGVSRNSVLTFKNMKKVSDKKYARVEGKREEQAEEQAAVLQIQKRVHIAQHTPHCNARAEESTRESRRKKTTQQKP